MLAPDGLAPGDAVVPLATGVGLLLAGRLSGAQAAAAGDGARASMGHGPWRGGELGGGSGQSYPREMGDAGSSEAPVMYDSAWLVYDGCCRSSSLGLSSTLPKPRPQSKDSIVDCRGSRRRGSALRPLNGLSVGSRPCDSRVIVLRLASELAGARVAYELVCGA